MVVREMTCRPGARCASGGEEQPNEQKGAGIGEEVST